MKTVNLAKSGKQVPSIIQGCMRIDSLSDQQLEILVEHQLERGINFFDHADCYGAGACEEKFGKLLKAKPQLRQQMIIQTKCGIRPGDFTVYDFSKKHILESVEGSLRRLQTDYIDVLLLHRPDALMEPEEVADAFDQLKASGKVGHFGVSNQNPGQMRLLSKYLNQRIEINQMQLSPARTGMLDTGFNVNTAFDKGIDRDGGVIEYCRMEDVTIQCWSPFQQGQIEGTFIGKEEYFELNQVLEQLAEKYGVSVNGAVIAWLLRHPADMQVVVGTVNDSRMDAISQASEIRLTREEWYQVYQAAGNVLP